MIFFDESLVISDKVLFVKKEKYNAQRLINNGLLVNPMNFNELLKYG